ncbi:MAG: DUF4292 domain-containing protein [Candidatus Latescibacteria bacterium]|nr:DUF4292 domain-containing protein [Candidatus Latescibacterota bacterium]
MKNTAFRCAVYAVITALVGIHAGCGLRPQTVVPDDITVDRAIAAVRENASRIGDFTGSVFVRASEGAGSFQSVRLSIRYKRPGRFRILVKAFAGLPVALISAAGDSVRVFLPSENAYIDAARSDNTLHRILPGVDFGIDRLTSFLTGFIPPDDVLPGCRKTLERLNGRTVLVLLCGEKMQRLTLAGRDMHITGEEILVNGDSVWRLRASGFRTVDGIPFPRKITMESERGAATVEFSGCSFNTGLDDAELEFATPPNADRLTFEKTPL